MLCEAFVCTHTSLGKCLHTHTYTDTHTQQPLELSGCTFSSQDNRSTVNCFAFIPNIRQVTHDVNRFGTWYQAARKKYKSKSLHAVGHTSALLSEDLNDQVSPEKTFTWLNEGTGRLRLRPEEQEQAVALHRIGNVFLCLARLSLFYSPIKFSATSDL